MIPVGDYPNPPKAQWMTRALIAINIAVHLFVTMPMEGRRLTADDLRENDAELKQMWSWQAPHYEPDGVSEQQWRRGISQYDLFVFKYGYKPADSSLLALFFCMFLHAGFAHLFGNMLFLWIYGDNVEYRLGSFAFLLWYLATGVVATLSFAFLAGNSLVPLVGASGAISGVLGFYLLWFPRNYVKIFLFFPFFGIIPIRAYWVLGIYVVLENIVPMMAGGGGGVAHGAHLGGFAAGLLIAYAYNAVKGKQPTPQPDRFERYRPGRGGPVDPQWRETPAAPVDHGGTFERAVREGRMESAAHAFSNLQREGGRRPEPHAVFRLGRWLYDEGFSPDSAAVFRYYVKNFPRGEDLDRVCLGLGILLSRRLGSPTAAREYLQQAIEITDTPAIAETARAELARLR